MKMECLIDRIIWENDDILIEHDVTEIHIVDKKKRKIIYTVKLKKD